MKRKKKPTEPNAKLSEGLRSLRHEVENQGPTAKLALVGGLTRPRELTDINILQFPPWSIGYKVVPVDVSQGKYERTIYVKIPGEKIEDIPVREMEPIMLSIFETMLDSGNSEPDIDYVAFDTMRIRQEFIVMFWKEMSPRVIVPGSRK